MALELVYVHADGEPVIEYDPETQEIIITNEEETTILQGISREDFLDIAAGFYLIVRDLIGVAQ